MATIIEFKQLSFEDHVRKRGQKSPCKSPIITKRYGYWGFSIKLHRGLFNIPFIENALRALAFGETWDLYKAKEDLHSSYAEYYIEVQEDYCRNTEEAHQLLLSINKRVIEKIYSEEIKVWKNEVSVPDLASPHHYTLSDGVNISAKTVATLASVGIKDVEELTALTREDLCQIPGMTTEEVARIERSLISRGIYLKPFVPSFP